MRTRHARAAIALTSIAALLMVACSSGSSSSSPTTAYCDQLNKVKASYQTLIDTNVQMDGTQQLKTNFQAFTDDLGALKTAAGSRFAGDISTLQTSATGLSSAIDGVLNGGGSIADLTTSLAGLKTSWDGLMTSVGSACSGG